MKKKNVVLLVTLCIVFIVAISNVYAVGSYEMKIEADKATAKPQDTVVVSFSLTNIAVEPGIGAMTGKLEYDKTVFEKVTSASIKSGEGWGTVTYNDQNESEGCFAVERAAADTIKVDNIVFEATFKVLSSSKLGDTEIKLTNISSSTGEKDVDIADVVGKLKIAKETPNENNNTTNNNTTNNNTTNNNTTNNNTTNNNTTNNNTTNNNTTNNNTTNNNTTNNNTTNNNTTNNNTTNNNTTNNNTTNNNKVTISDKDIPYAGINDYILPAIFVVIAIGAFGYIQYKRMKNI